MKRLLGAMLLVTLSGCGVIPPDLAAILESLFGGGSTTGPGGINSGAPAGNPVPELGEFVGVRIISESAQDADVLVRFLIGDFEVRRTELRVPALSTSEVIGPDIAAEVEVSGAYLDGPALETIVLLVGEDFSEGDLIEIVIPALPDGEDACPDDPAKMQPGQCGCGVPDTDTDGDGVADCLDECPEDPGKTESGLCGCGSPDIDADGDTVLDCFDECPEDPAKILVGICGCGVADADFDEDGTADCIDECPEDSGKVIPGVCGCGVPDFDSDEDGTPDCNDGCPEDPNKLEPGECGCGVADVDSDEDDVLDCEDGCPQDPGKIAPGVCGCGIPDTDSDGDETPDCNDECPQDPGKIAPGLCGCGIPDTDTDGDETPDCKDECPEDPGKTAPGVCGCDVPDTDTDGDQTPDCLDLCPEDPLKVDPGLCGCGVVDSEFDEDEDGVPDCIDVCPFGDDNEDCNGNGVPDDCDDAARLYWTGQPSMFGEVASILVDGDCSADVLLPYEAEPGSIDLDLAVPGSEWMYWMDSAIIRRADLGGFFGSDVISLSENLFGGLAVDQPTREIYWTELYDQDGEFVYVYQFDPNADLDPVPQYVTSLDGTSPGGLAVDTDLGVLYWTQVDIEIGAGQIYLLDLDQPEPFAIPLPVGGPGTLIPDVALDPGAQTIYWIENSAEAGSRIRRGTLAGTPLSPDPLIELGQEDAGRLALDVLRQKIYWTTLRTGTISRADLNGMNIESGLISVAGPVVDIVIKPNGVAVPRPSVDASGR